LAQVMGVGILALPRAVANVGLVPGVLMMLGIAALSLLTLCLLAESIREWKAKTYAQLVSRSIGPGAARACAVAVTVNLFGACVGANVAMATTFEDLLTRAGLMAVDDATGQVQQVLANNVLHLPPLANRQLWIVVLGAGLVLPLSLRGTYRALGPASLLSTLSASVLALVACGFFVAAALPGGDGIPCRSCPPLEMGRWSPEVLDSASIFMFAFVTHSILPQVLSELEDPTEHRVRTTLTGMVVSGLRTRLGNCSVWAACESANRALCIACVPRSSFSATGPSDGGLGALCRGS
jgi:amino acid permease